MRIGARSPGLHPIAIVLTPIPAIIVLLLAEGVGYGLACLAVALVLSIFRGPRVAGGLALLIVAGTALLWFGFTMALPAEPFGQQSPIIHWLPFQPTRDQALLGLRASLRISGIAALYVAALSFVKWRVLGDSLIKHFGIPYRIVDVSSLGGRFAIRVRQDFAAVRTQARLRTRGHRMRQLRLRLGSAVPVLIASFRHADELAVAMEARGFGAHQTRTVHHARPVRARDVLVLLLIWAVSITAGVLLL